MPTLLARHRRVLPVLCGLLLAGCLHLSDTSPATIESAYRRAGLGDAEAAAILLDRFTFGARPGAREALLAQGADAWFAEQLAGVRPEPTLGKKLAALDTGTLGDAELMARFPGFSRIAAHARRFYPGTIPPRDEPVVDFPVIADKLEVFSAEHGFEVPEQVLIPQLEAQKLLRAVYAENQLREVMTDFWQNHFFTGTSEFGARSWMLSLERDVLRPLALDPFPVLLRASSQHPATLAYFEREAQDAALDSADSLMAVAAARSANAAEAVDAAAALIERIDHEQDLILERRFWPPTGPNLELARSFIELRTLGAQGDWSEDDVFAAARIFTGWSVRPYGADARWFAVDYRVAEPLGFALRGSFWFRADRHDAGVKTVLGAQFPAGGGVEEGECLLNLLAAHPDTARHLAGKLARRFAGAEVEPALVAQLAAAFAQSGGDTRAVLAALVRSPAFWRASARRDRVKTPLVYVASALRAAAVDIDDAAPALAWLARMGQPPYRFLDPGGYPDRNEAWLEPAAMAARFGFASELAAGELAGLRHHPTPALALRIAAPDFQVH